ncbi:MAG: family transcriptional regulator, cyclic receptor protein, partial [Frankiaceae bacterium]|nr:family transcriptional regulator, cyclic receptor protein [Frankiaceae bacterium]
MLTAVDDLLARMPVFSGLAEDARKALAEQLERRVERRGAMVFAEGEAGDSVYIVLNGKVKISRRSGDGRENLLAVLGPGDIFGELSLFDPGPRTATASAVTDIEVASLEHSALRPWLGRRPEAAELLLKVLARRLRRTNEAM